MNASGTRYGVIAIALHWLVALLVFVAFPLGLYAHDLPLSVARLKLINYHKWLGVSVFALAILRVLWRQYRRPPPLPAGMGRLEQAAAVFMHAALYALILAIPVSGWIMSSATGLQTVWFGRIPFPDLVGRDKPLADFMLSMHQALSWSLAMLVLLHVLAALKHHFLARDDVLARMLPWRPGPGRRSA